MNLSDVIDNYLIRIEEDTNHTLEVVKECVEQSKLKIDDTFKRFFMEKLNKR